MPTSHHDRRSAEDADSWHRPPASVIKPTLAAISLALIALLAIFAVASTAQADSNNIEWLAYQTEEDGFGYIRYQGSTLDDLEADLSASGCDLRGLWVYRNHEWDIYHTEAPAFLNAPFVRKYGGNLPHDTTITLQCRNPEHVLDVSIPDYELEPTKIEWITTPEINTERNKQGTAIIQYGGGSFYKLTQRLAVEGCDVINVEIGEVEYDFRKSGASNRLFTSRYDENIPSYTNMQVACVDRCDIIIGLDLVEDANWKKDVESRDKCLGKDSFSFSRPVVGDAAYVSDCHTDWSDSMREALKAMPVPQNACRIDIVYDHANPYNANRFTGYATPGVQIRDGVMFSQYTPFVGMVHFTFHETRTYGFNDPEYDPLAAHELCHVNQYWYAYKHYVDYDYLANHPDTVASMGTLWDETPMAKELAEIVGFTQNHEGDWVPASDGVYRQIFPYDPELIELAAEICVFHLAEKVIGPTLLSVGYSRPELVEQDAKLYGLQEVEEWAEKYVLISP